MKKILVGFLALALVTTCCSGSVSAQEKKQDTTRQRPDGKNRKGKRRGGQRRPDNAPRAGELAPTFVLKSLDGKSETDLASFRNKKPVVLFFGSYT